MLNKLLISEIFVSKSSKFVFFVGMFALKALTLKQLYNISTYISF